MPAISLSGDWTGVYDYSDAPDFDPVTFYASLTDVAGVIWGTSLERSTAPDSDDMLEAALNGSRSGREVRFRKVYTSDMHGGELPIDYAGTLSTDGNRITGTWRFFVTGTKTTGPFIMNRHPVKESEVLRQLSAMIEIKG